LHDRAHPRQVAVGLALLDLVLVQAIALADFGPHLPLGVDRAVVQAAQLVGADAESGAAAHLTVVGEDQALSGVRRQGHVAHQVQLGVEDEGLQVLPGGRAQRAGLEGAVRRLRFRLGWGGLLGHERDSRMV